jgi:hypothetical protein
LILDIGVNNTIVAEDECTVAAMLKNPFSTPEPDDNVFGMLIKAIVNGEEKTLDANMKIPGLTLQSLPAKVEKLSWSNPVGADTVARVRFGLRITKMIPSNGLTDITIKAPDGMMYNPDTLSVGPDILPLTKTLPITVQGLKLNLKLDTNQPLEQGAYDITFAVQNPSKLPVFNAWSVQLNFNGRTRYETFLSGYEFGQTSPDPVPPPQEVDVAPNYSIVVVIAIFVGQA